MPAFSAAGLAINSFLTHSFCKYLLSICSAQKRRVGCMQPHENTLTRILLSNHSQLTQRDDVPRCTQVYLDVTWQPHCISEIGPANVMACWKPWCAWRLLQTPGLPSGCTFEPAAMTGHQHFMTLATFERVWDKKGDVICHMVFCQSVDPCFPRWLPKPGLSMRWFARCVRPSVKCKLLPVPWWWAQAADQSSFPTILTIQEAKFSPSFYSNNYISGKMTKVIE